MRPVVEFAEILEKITDESLWRPVPANLLGEIQVLNGAERLAVWPRLQVRADFGGVDAAGARLRDAGEHTQRATPPYRRFVPTLEQLPREMYGWMSVQNLNLAPRPCHGLPNVSAGVEGLVSSASSHAESRYEEVVRWLRSLPIRADELVMIAPVNLTNVLGLPWSLLADYWQAFIHPMASYNVTAPGEAWLLVLEGDEVAAFCWEGPVLPPGMPPTTPWMPLPQNFREVRRGLACNRR